MNPISNPSIQKIHALSLNRDQWGDWLKTKTYPSYRSTQIYDWIYKKNQLDPRKMLNLPPDLRVALSEEFDWLLPEPITKMDSPSDQTTKILFPSPKSRQMETVLMRYENRTSLCVSTQVGCKLACSFCQTGKLGFFENLRSSDILAQVFGAQKILDQENSGRRITHVVFMGMGEPFDNFQASVDAADRLMDPDAFGLSASRVTISTSGVAAKFTEFAKISRASLALSLHAANDETRSKIMPINRKYDLDTLKKSCLEYQRITGKILTLEYILLKDINCDARHAKDLVKWIHGLRVKVNLIPFNDHPGMEYQRPSDQTIRNFQAYLSQRSIPAPVRYSRGLDISAACGQLAAKNMETMNQAPSRSNFLEQSKNYLA